MTDILVNGQFLSINEIYTRLSTRKGKQNLIFDYATLRHAIPRTWLHCNMRVANDSSLEIPYLYMGSKQQRKCLYDVTSRQFYRLLSAEESDANRCCVRWGHIIDSTLDWMQIFRRDLRIHKENKLGEFNFKLLYNLLPVKRNLYKWGIIADGRCTHCRVDEDDIHAFIECDLNKKFFAYLTTICKVLLDREITTTEKYLIKANPENELDSMFTVAFWCIHKYIVKRNLSGKDNRENNLEHLFKREIHKRIEDDMHSTKNIIIFHIVCCMFYKSYYLAC